MSVRADIPSPLVLASKSPRRAKILSDLGFAFEVLATESREVSVPHAPKRTCVEMCSAQAIMPGENPGDPPKFDREKCVHCGACIWNCARLVTGTDHGNIVFKAGSGGLHSNEN